LQRLLGNLVVNAVKYGDKEAPVRIRIAEDGERVRFEVRNTGTAIEGAGVGGAVIDEVQLRVVSEPTPYRASADLPCVGRPALDAQVGAAVGGIERLKVRADQHILDLLDRSIRDDRASGKGEATPEIVVIRSFHTASARSSGR
jgi:hypothetical protein